MKLTVSPSTKPFTCPPAFNAVPSYVLLALSVVTVYSPDGPNTPEEKKTGITATDPVDSIYDGKAHVNPLTVKDTKTNKDLKENKDYTLTYSDDVVNVGTVTEQLKVLETIQVNLLRNIRSHQENIQ